MPQMNNDTLNQELDRMSMSAVGNDATLMRTNEYLYDRYNAELLGDEKPGRSKVVSNDVADVVEADMPALSRIFLGPGDILKFTPTTASPDDRQEAEDKTKYVDWQIRGQPWSFTTLTSFIKDALIGKLAVLYYYIDKCEEVEEHKRSGLSDEELAVFEADLKSKNGVVSVEIDREEEPDEGVENTVVFKVRRETELVKIDGIELENFRMTPNAKDKDSAELVGHVETITRGELLSKGFDKELISKIQRIGKDAQDNTRMNVIRSRDEGTAQQSGDSSTWAGEQVVVEMLFPKIDYDGDGIAERRMIVRAGDVILSNEVFNHVPYAVMSSILMPHRVIGKSRAEVTAPTAISKTFILRGINDNIAAVNAPRIGANANVNIDDLLVLRPNGVIRSKGESSPGQNLYPVQVPFIGQEALMVLQYWDLARAQTTGSLMASQGLNADALNKETATRFDGVQDEGAAKLELVARTMAETGFRQLYEGVAWLDSNFQNTEIETAILGHELKVKPTDWRYKHSVRSRVGLGAGDDEKKTQTLSALWALHQQLQAVNSPMTDEVKRFNVLSGLVKASGEPDVAEYFNNPNLPEEQILAENEILKGIVEQLQQQLQQMQNPLAEAETIKARAAMVQAQARQQLEIAKLAEDQRQFNEKEAQDADEFNKKLALDISREAHK